MSTPRKKPVAVKPVLKKSKPTPKASANGPLGLEDIKALIALAGREPFQEFEFEAGDMRFRIRKDGPAPTFQAQAPAPILIAAPAPAPAPASASVPAPPVAVAEDPAIHYVTSPIVGTFYRSSNPTAPPYVSSGDFVRPGQTLCIIEAMKLMNEIESDVAGEVVKVLVENGTPVEYGERLYAVRVG